MKLINLFDKPKLIGLVANINQGKSNTLYHIIEQLRAEADFRLYTFGLRMDLDFAHQIFTLDELEDIENSIIIIDEAFNLLDMDNRAKRKQIEQTMRLLNHRNCIVVLCLLPENCKKFLASKLDVTIFKKCTIADFINGSMTKRIVQSYSGYEKGTAVLNIPIDRALVYDGKKFANIHVDYYPQYDSKKGNSDILTPKYNNVVTNKRKGSK